MNIRPLQDRIIVERVEEETTTAGGIIIPDTVSKEKPQEGKIIAAGWMLKRAIGYYSVNMLAVKSRLMASII